MIKTLLIGNKEIEMAANAASPFIYKQLFHEDLLMQIGNMQDSSPDVNVFTQLAFVMAKQGEGLTMKELTSLSKDDFYTWLEDFEPMSFVTALGEITGLYFGQTKSMSVPKSTGE